MTERGKIGCGIVFLIASVIAIGSALIELLELEPKQFNKIEATIKINLTIEKLLEEYPGTATHPWTYDFEKIHTDKGDKWVTKSYVDGQDSFGAPKRVNFVAIVDVDGKIVDLKKDETP